MKNTFIKIDFFYFLLFMLFSAEAPAQQCIQLFAQAPSLSQIQSISVGFNNVMLNLDSMLAGNYKAIQSARTLTERNQTLQNIRDLNNKVLELFDAITTNPILNSTISAQMFQNGIIENLLKLFKKQGFSSELIRTIVNSRTALNAKLENELKRSTSPIGFFHNDAADPKTVTRRTIGFNSNELESELYGRNKQENEVTAINRARSRIGFIHSSERSVPAKPLKSIGFVQSEDGVDVAYFLSLAFDFDTGAFMAISSQNPIGFRTQ